MKKFLAGLSAVAVLAAGGVAMVGLGSNAAIAQEEDATTQDTPDQEAENQDGRKHRGHLGLRHGLATAAETIGIDVEDLVTEVQAGSSVADVAAVNGSSGQAVIDAIVANASERIDTAVENGRFTAEEGAAKLSEVTTRITDFVNGDLELRERGDRGRRGPQGTDATDA